MRLFLLILLFNACISREGRAQSGKVNSQSVFNSTGGTYQKGYYIIDWSVGELSLVNEMTNITKKLIVTNGFMQPFTEFANPVNNDKLFADDEIRILPNPTSDVLEINFRTQQRGHVQFSLYDVTGTRVYIREFISYGYGQIEKINMTGLANGTYFLHILLNPDPGFTGKKGNYKIVKIQ